MLELIVLINYVSPENPTEHNNNRENKNTDKETHLHHAFAKKISLRNHASYLTMSCFYCACIMKFMFITAEMLMSFILTLKPNLEVWCSLVYSGIWGLTSPVFSTIILKLVLISSSVFLVSRICFYILRCTNNARGYKLKI